MGVEQHDSGEDGNEGRSAEFRWANNLAEAPSETLD
jgi:hypothetical protein